MHFIIGVSPPNRPLPYIHPGELGYFQYFKYYAQHPMKDNWYELEYEANGENETCSGPTVLYTSRHGLSSLHAELQRVSNAGPGRHELKIEGMDRDYYLPFSHVEVTDTPPKNEEKKWSWRPIIWLAGIVIVALFLALYGMVRLVMDIVS